MPSTSKPKIAKVKNTLSAADMWAHFISKRRPVIIDGLLKDPEWKADKWTDLEYLRSAAGDVPVKIEPVHPDAGHFGTSVKRNKVKFSEFLSILQDESKAGKWYLTTQYIEDGEDEQESRTLSAKSSDADADADLDSDDSDYEPELDNVLPAPTNALSNDFPAKPELLGDLVLQQCNLWLGNSKEGKSSGLHHDFHDNLYILLSGYKRFLLFPPSAHRYLHPRGLVDRVYPNGLIVYAPLGEYPSYVPVRGRRPQLPIRSDGLVPSDAARWRRKARLRVKREIDERAAADAGEGSRVKSQRKGKAKQTRAQELAEEALLQAEAELRICRMDEEGIDPEADTSDEADEDASNPDFDGILNSLVEGADHLQSDESSDEHGASDDEDDSDIQVRRLLAALPSHMKPIAVQALAGDQAASEKLSLYMESIADSSPAEESSAASDAQDENNLSASDAQEGASSDDEQGGLEDAQAFATVESNGISRKRKQASHPSESADSDAEAQDESDTIESDGATTTVKRVKIAARAENIDLGEPSDEDEKDSQDSERYHEVSSEEDEEEDDDDDEDKDEDDEEEGLPAFSVADSGSEFGDVDDGEAELERLLAMAEGQDSDSESEPANDDNDPQSFSRISPHVLHQCLNVPDDPSRPTKDAGPSHGRAKNGRASEQYRPLPGCPPPIEVFLKPGQMLYLPASWYHEVTSSSLPPLHNQDDADQQEKPQNKVHMALNYWFHPPDALEFEPVETRPAAAGAAQVVVPGLGVGIGESALESRGAGTGTHERPYRDPEVWDEVAHAVAEQIQLARESASSK